LLLAGAIAGCPAAYLCTPADVIKTRLQSDAKGAIPRFTGLRDCFFKTWKEEGLRTFFVGGGMRVLRSSPQFAVTLLVYEVLQTKFAPQIKNPRPLVTVPISSEEYNRAHSTVRKILPNV
jgi:solute carrier family 25 aspartate/glutamate transporter 12/13